MSMVPLVIERIRFRNIPRRRYAEFVVQVESAKQEIVLYLDQDVDAIGGWDSAECRAGMETRQAELLVRLLRNAVHILPETGSGPSVAASVAFKWSSPGKPGAECTGITIVASSGRITLGITSGVSSIGDAFLATFDYATGERLISALQRSLEALQGRGSGAQHD